MSGNAKPWHLLNKDNYIDQKIADQRFSICLECPRLIKKTKQCRECGCFMELKTKLYNAYCPIGKWGEIERNTND
jgi:hypothetical protein